MKKGSQIQLAGRLVQERWQQDNQNRSRVVIVAEAITYAGSFQKNGNSSDSSANTSSSKPAANSVPDEF